jgi:hypothetical protein
MTQPAVQVRLLSTNGQPCRALVRLALALCTTRPPSQPQLYFNKHIGHASGLQCWQEAVATHGPSLSHWHLTRHYRMPHHIDTESHAATTFAPSTERHALPNQPPRRQSNAMCATGGGELVAVETSALPSEPGERLPVELCVDTRGLASAALSFVEGRHKSERTHRGTPLCIAFDAYLQTTRETLRLDFGTARAPVMDVGTDAMRGEGGQLVLWLQSRVTNNTTEPPIRLSRYVVVEVV